MVMFPTDGREIYGTGK